MNAVGERPKPSQLEVLVAIVIRITLLLVLMDHVKRYSGRSCSEKGPTRVSLEGNAAPPPLLLLLLRADDARGVAIAGCGVEHEAPRKRREHSACMPVRQGCQKLKQPLDL